VTIAMICIGRHLDRQYGPPSPISIEEFRESIEWIASGKATLIRHQPKHFLGFDLGDTIQVDVSVGVEATKSPLCLLRGMIEVDRKKLATEGQSWLIGKAATRRNGLEGGISTHLVLTEIPSDSPHKGGLEYHLFVEGKRGDRRNRIPCSRSDECLAAL
jgi:hypothetical protein